MAILPITDKPIGVTTNWEILISGLHGDEAIGVSAWEIDGSMTGFYYPFIFRDLVIDNKGNKICGSTVRIRRFEDKILIKKTGTKDYMARVWCHA